VSIRVVVLVTITTVLAAALACAGSMEPVTAPVSVPYPDGFSQASIELDFGVAHIDADAAGTQLVEGNITYNTLGREPEITVSDDRVHIKQSGPAGVVGSGSINNWVLHFGAEMPFSLEIEAGAYTGNWELGGLPLTALNVTEGAASSTYSFSAANPEAMACLHIGAGAGSMRLLDVVNANFERLSYDGGAGSLVLDLGGELVRDGVVDIDAGAASVTVVVPEDTPARVDIAGGASSIEADAGFELLSGDYVTPAWTGHEGPGLEIQVNVVAGSLTLTLE